MITFRIIVLYVLLTFIGLGTACRTGTADQSGSVSTAAVTEEAAPLTRIAFGSCSRQDREQPLWPFVRQNNPQLWIWLGDNIYGDTEDMAVLKAKYDQQKSHPEYQNLRASAEIIGIWDDHDYGVNDGGKEYPMKKESQQLMLEFLDEPAESPRWKREGAYASYTYGPAGKQTKVILLDARYFRDPLKKAADGKANVPDETGEILGDAQWKWLEAELTGSPAAVHLIASGIQIIPEEHIYEKWANFPTERRRLFDLIGKTGAPGVILLSGDRHIAEISKYEHPGISYPLYEVTASGLTHASTNNTSEPNRHRVGNLVNVLNFGLMEIDWSSPEPRILLQVRGLENQVLDEVQVAYSPASN
jgi:alkaline phosphatase D